MQNVVDIWDASIFDAKPYADQLYRVLSDAERRRGERLVDPKNGERFLLCHAILRDVLSRYLKQAPGAIIFSNGAYGKPFITSSTFRFNMTHSLDRVLIVVTQTGEVGIDIENIQKTHSFDLLVKRYFAEEEREAYFSYCSAKDRRLAFYRGWTRKEAYLKAIGLGLSYPLDQFVVSLIPDEQHALISVEGDTMVRSKWTLASVNVDRNYLAAVAVKTPNVNIMTHVWSV